MSTRTNYNLPSHAHELTLTFSCYRGYPLLSKDRTRQWLSDAISNACEKHGYLLWGYVFMPEHAHLLVWPMHDSYDIAKFRGAIKEPVGRKAMKYLKANAPDWLDKLTRTRRGRIERLFWQPGGGYDRNIDNPATIRPVINYFTRTLHAGAWLSLHWIGFGPALGGTTAKRPAPVWSIPLQSFYPKHMVRVAGV